MSEESAESPEVFGTPSDISTIDYFGNFDSYLTGDHDKDHPK